MNFEPYAYQQHAIDHVINNTASGLFLDMGLGKTVTTLTAIDILMYQMMEVSKVLVIAPLRVAESVWDEEINKWDHLKHLRISKVLGTAKARKMALKKPADIYIINRENVAWLTGLYGTAFPFDMVVIDELSSFKAHNTKRFKQLRMVRPYVSRIVGLTGTPAPNSLIDLWPQVYLLDRGERLEKTVGAYRRRYFSPGRSNGQVVFDYNLRRGSEQSIYDKISDICISMKAEDYIDVPEKIDNIVKVQLTPKERAQYVEMEKDEILSLPEGDINAVNAAALSGKLLQLSNGACYDDEKQVIELHDRKLDALDEIIESASGKPVLVFYQYRHDLERIKKRFPEAVKLEGDREVKRWNAKKIPLLVTHPASAGHGLNLQRGGNTIVWFGLTWSLEQYQQANARLHRQGQTEAVIVHHLVTDNTIDEEVMKALANKASGQDELMAAVKARVERYQDEQNTKNKVHRTPRAV